MIKKCVQWRNSQKFCSICRGVSVSRFTVPVPFRTGSMVAVLQPINYGYRYILRIDKGLNTKNMLTVVVHLSWLIHAVTGTYRRLVAKIFIMPPFVAPDCSFFHSTVASPVWSLNTGTCFICIKSRTQPPQTKLVLWPVVLSTFSWNLIFYIFNVAAYVFFSRNSKFVLPCLGSKTIYFLVCNVLLFFVSYLFFFRPEVRHLPQESQTAVLPQADTWALLHLCSS